MRRRLLTLASSLCALLVVQAQPSAQQGTVQPPQTPQTAQAPPPPQATFRAAAHLIVQTVSVKDKSGKPIQGLTAKDFVVTENGVPQDIAFVEYQAIDDAPLPPMTDIPIARPPSATSSVAPLTQVGTSMPLPGDVRYRGKRLLVLYFDLYNMPFFDQLRLFSSAYKYITTQMTTADMVAVMVFDDSRVRLVEDFTDDRAALLGVIQQLAAAANDSQNGAAATDFGGAFGEDNDTFNLFSTDRQLAALQTAVTGFGPLPEKKTVVYFGSGLRLNGADNLAQLRATVNAAVRSNVTINPVDTRGLTASAPMGDATTPSRGGVGMFSGALAQAATTRQQQSQDTYYALAKDTGGLAMFDNNDISLGIVQAAKAVTGYYMLGYYTKNATTDGKWRRVNVTLARSLPAELAYREGYYGAKDYSKFNAVDRERQLEEALRAEDPITDIPMEAEINYFQISGAEYFVPVSVRMPGSELTRSSQGGKVHAVIDMIGEVKDEYAVTIRNSKDLLDFTMDAATANQAARRPIQYETGYSLLPGKYTIKVLARDTTTGRIGTYLKSFEIPNLDREHLRLPTSTVILTNQRVVSTDALYTVRQKISADVANPLVSDGQKLIPSVTRSFRTSQPLFVFLEAYERDATTLRPLVAYVTLYQGDVKAFESEALAIAEGWDPKTRKVPIRFSLSVTDLPAGSYDCQVSVLDPASGKAAFLRTTIELRR